MDDRADYAEHGRPQLANPALDQLARIDAILARSDHLCEPSFCAWRRDIRDIREVRGL